MIVSVLVELSTFALDKTFNYLVPADKKDQIKLGIRVIVPFANQHLEGFVLAILDETESDIDIASLKTIDNIVDGEAILTNELMELGRYISKTTMSTLISAYQVMLPRALKANYDQKFNVQYDTYIVVNDLALVKLTDKQREIINLLVRNNNIMLYRDLKNINSVVDTLLKKGIVKKIKKEKYRSSFNNYEKEPKKELTLDQQKVAEEVINNLSKELTYLLYGVTGSGKTEVYMEIIEDVIKNNRQALLLVPEITLASQIVKRFYGRFARIAILHSGLSDGEKYDEYRKIRRGEVDIVIGARSAIFAPLSNIGIIIVDECHSSSYKQDNMPRYDSINVALYRSRIHKCPVILGSATPPLELFARAQKGLFKLLWLPKRIGQRTLPKVQLCDMTKEKRVNNTYFSTLLYETIQKTLECHEQIILLINRRGYSSSLTCRQCGYTFKCPNCDIGLTYHKEKDILRCHYCGYATNKTVNCPNCHTNNLHDLGSGTEKVEEEIKTLFPLARLVRMDLDTTTKKGSHEKIVNDFANFKYDILLGTQMIAKGLDFPNVTLVGVINADTSLFIPSYKSSENTFQLLSQVAGRCGRGDKKGQVIIQTYNVDHYAITYASTHNYLGFYQEEMKNRLASKYPPYYYLAYVIVKSKDYNLASMNANKIANILKDRLLNSEVLGPTTCLPFKINNVCRFGILLKYKKEDDLYSVLRDLIDHYKANNKLKIDIDFNPWNI